MSNEVGFICCRAACSLVWRRLGQIAAGRGAGVHLRRHHAHPALEELAVAVQPQPVLGHPEPYRHRLILDARDGDARARRRVLELGEAHGRVRHDLADLAHQGRAAVAGVRDGDVCQPEVSLAAAVDGERGVQPLDGRADGDARVDGVAAGEGEELGARRCDSTSRTTCGQRALRKSTADTEQGGGGARNPSSAAVNARGFGTSMEITAANLPTPSPAAAARVAAPSLWHADTHSFSSPHSFLVSCVPLAKVQTQRCGRGAVQRSVPPPLLALPLRSL